VAGHLIVGEHVLDFFSVAGHGDADAGLVADGVQAAAAGRLQEYTAPADEGGAIKELAVVLLGPREVGLGGDSVVQHSLAFVGIDVDSPAAALLFAGVSSAIGFVEKWQ
jgi:hypothetical protein